MSGTSNSQASYVVLGGHIQCFDTCVYYRPSIIACHVFYCDASGRLVLLLSVNWLIENNAAARRATANASSVTLPAYAGSRAGACFAGGNVLVCAAVKRERKLRSMFNYFLVSLALSDMLSAILVMPLSIMRQLVGQHTAILCIDVKNINYSFAVC